jgi:hypothetical protein
VKATHYPPASKSRWYADTHPGTTFSTIEKITNHSTETSGLPGYSGGSMAPNYTALPNTAAKCLDWYEHFPLNMSSRALQNLSGGVETNMDNNVQIELVGTTDENGPGIFWPNAPDWCYRDLAEFYQFVHDEWGTPLNFAEIWLPYPESYGNTKARMAPSTYNAFRGILAHQHTPENDHGDVFLDIPRLKTFLSGKEEDIMGDVNITGISEGAAQALSKAVWERYETAVDIENLQRDVAHLVECLNVFAEKFEVELPNKI